MRVMQTGPSFLARAGCYLNEIMDMERTILHFDDTEKQIAEWASMRNRDLHRIKPHTEETLSQFEVQGTATASVHYWWLSLVCRNRD